MYQKTSRRLKRRDVFLLKRAERKTRRGSLKGFHGECIYAMGSSGCTAQRRMAGEWGYFFLKARTTRSQTRREFS